MQPGQMHFWKLSKDIDGFVFFHTREFYDGEYSRTGIHNFKFFESFQSIPSAQLDKKKIKSLIVSLEEMLKEFNSCMFLRSQKLHALMNLVYIEVSRTYPGGKTTKSSRYLDTFHQFENLLEKDYRENKLPRHYASELNITEKHLNRICRECVNKTSTQIIAERLSLEAKRLLSQSKENITEISFDLGFSDPSYFIRFFKKQTGATPLAFQKKYFS
jgi:AraC-like DNA-binding protein